jgi:hypothetical protein
MPHRIALHDNIEPLSGSSEVLYRIYLEIAAKDHRCRIQALYGNQSPPSGHTPYRPLPIHHFVDRLESAKSMPNGEELFRKQLARLARVYSVDCVAAVTDRVAA